MKGVSLIIVGIVAGCVAGMYLPKSTDQSRRGPHPIVESQEPSANPSEKVSAGGNPVTTYPVSTESATPSSETHAGPQIISTSTILGRQAPTHAVVSRTGSAGSASSGGMPSIQAPRPQQPSVGGKRC